MGYDHELADRIRDVLAGVQGVREQKMFGGLAFLINGNMSVAAIERGGLMVRVNPEQTDVLVDNDHVSPMVMRGRELRGWLTVDAAALESADQLEQWVDRGVTYARSLPPKRKG
jgi:TfoX/Sxy family transcriptional regulator of competence genes